MKQILLMLFAKLSAERCKNIFLSESWLIDTGSGLVETTVAVLSDCTMSV